MRTKSKEKEEEELFKLLKELADTPDNELQGLSPSAQYMAQIAKKIMAKQDMELLDATTGRMKCKKCGYEHFAQLGKGRKYKRGSWQCPNCKPLVI